jgi:hypothetical protein
MPILVDGDNLLGTWPGRRRSDHERRWVASRLARWAARGGRRIVVVFDGPPLSAGASNPDLRFAGSGRSADDVILEFLRRQGNPRDWTVVTSDRSLGDQCRHLQARVQRCDQFRKRLTDHDAEEKPDREADVDYWLRQFGEHDEDSA